MSNTQNIKFESNLQLAAAEPRPSQKMARRAVVPDFIFDS